MTNCIDSSLLLFINFIQQDTIIISSDVDIWRKGKYKQTSSELLSFIINSLKDTYKSTPALFPVLLSVIVGSGRVIESDKLKNSKCSINDGYDRMIIDWCDFITQKIILLLEEINIQN